MYRAERVVNGVLCWRGTPDGEWVQYTPEELTERIRLIKMKLANAKSLIESFEDEY